MKRLLGILSVLVCATSMSYAQADGIATLQSSDVDIPLNDVARGKVIDSGSCGKGVNYELYEDYTLRIYGNGAMDDYSTYSNTTKLLPDQAPWGIELYKKIKEVVIENGVTHIGGRSFYECASLTKATIPSSIKSIGYDAFYSCTRLTNITIPDGVTSIRNRAFMGCSGFTSITIPNSVTSIGESAFSDCTRLTSITIPNSVTSIGENAFYDCSGLTSITIPNSVTSIGEAAFEGCTKLKYVKIPKNVTEIGYQAFPQTGDKDLVIEFTSETPATLYDVESFGFLCTIYVSENALETYLNAKYWKDHADQILPKEQATGISSVGSEKSEKKTAIYDLQGRKVAEVQPNGMYIVNGKKIVMK